MGTSDVVKRRWLGPALEVLVSLVTMAGFLVLCLNIRIDPMQRIGQVSGLAALQVRFLGLVLPLLAVLIAVARYRTAWFATTSRLTCAALAGLASAFVAGGIIVALRGTPWCLNANGGDSDIIAMWANAIKHHYAPLYPPKFYPPLYPYLVRWYMGASDLPAYFALKHLQIGLTALTGPVAYVTWRLLLRPGWALGIGVVAALVLIDPYKPYENLVLIVFVPVMICFLQKLRRAADSSIFEVARAGVIFGVVLGVLCLTYSGWFRWSAPGVVVAACCVFPWRTARGRGAILAGLALLVFVVATWGYLADITSYVKEQNSSSAAAASKPIVQDDYIYFDVKVDPAYVAMWKGDLPGTITDWPPAGELAGVAVFTLLLIAGTGTAIALGRKRTVVITAGIVLAGVWFQRFWYAHQMYHTKFVQLYPRTSIEIMYLLLVLSGFAIYYLVEYAARRGERAGPLRNPSGMIGAMCSMSLLLGMMGSSIANRYMPEATLPRSPGFLAWMAHEAERTHVVAEPSGFPP